MPQSYTDINLHFIFGTKERRRLITPDLNDRLYAYIGGTVANERGRLLVAGGMPDHVHLLISMPGQMSASDMMRLVKTNSSRWVHETFPGMGEFGWQDGFGAFSVSHSAIERVREYIERQAEHHRTMTFEEEFAEFLNRHEIAFDPRYLPGGR